MEFGKSKSEDENNVEAGLLSRQTSGSGLQMKRSSSSLRAASPDDEAVPLVPHVRQGSINDPNGPGYGSFQALREEFFHIIEDDMDMVNRFFEVRA